MEIMEIVYHFIHFTTIALAVKWLGRSSGGVTDWYNLCRDIPVAMWNRRKPMGGPGEIIQIDESLFQGKRKYHRGRLLNSDRPVLRRIRHANDDDNDPDGHNPMKNYGKRVQGPWVFGMAWKRSDGVTETRLLIVEKRDRDTLFPIIKKEILPGSTIHSDQWAAYRTLNTIGYTHCMVNHSENFVDPETGAHTQTIERVWRTIKRRHGIKIHGATALLERRLYEEWWRSVNKDDPFEAFLRDMKTVYLD